MPSAIDKALTLVEKCEALVTDLADHVNRADDNRAQRQGVVEDLLTGNAQITTQDGSSIQVTAESLGFKDLEAAMNMRGWLAQAVFAKGAITVGGGYGFGAADLEIELEGHRYLLSIRPIDQT